MYEEVATTCNKLQIAGLVPAENAVDVVVLKIVAEKPAYFLRT